MSAPAGYMFSSYTTKILNIIHKFNQGALLRVNTINKFLKTVLPFFNFQNHCKF